MLQLAERHLHLRHDIPLGGAPFGFGQITSVIGVHDAAEALILREGVAERGAQEAFDSAPLRVIGWDLVAGVQLQESVGAERSVPNIANGSTDR